MVGSLALHPIYLCKAMLPTMQKRKHRSAIVITSSLFSLRATAGNATYCASKTFVSYLAEALYYELKDHQIDCLNWIPGETSTKMLRRREGGRVVSTDHAAKYMFRDIGKEVTSRGCIEHDVAGWFVDQVPTGMWNHLLRRELDKIYAR